MTEATSTEIIQLIEKGIRKAADQGEYALLSYTESLSEVNPLIFFDNSEKSFKGNRHYWSSPEGLTLVSAGATAKLTASGVDRITQINEQANALYNELYLECSHIEGTGPLFFSGFSFHSTINDQDELWNAFQPAEALMPEWILTHHPKQNDWMLTFNYRLSSGDQTAAIHHYYEKIKGELLTEREERNYPVSIPVEGNEDKVDEWLNNVRNAIDKINRQELKKVVLSRTLSLSAKEDFNVIHTLKRLRSYRNESYIFMIERENSVFLGATPEQLIEKKASQFQTMCLAGTIQRGNSLSEDKTFGNELLHDTKNLSEHQMVVDMITDAMKQICHRVTYPSHPAILKTKSVQHLYTPVTGDDRDNHHILELVNLLHPTPAMGGVPLHPALEVIQESEMYERGWYASPIGWFDDRGEGEFVVGIRSALIEKKNAVLFAGCGIVGDSKPQSEREETKMKFRPMIYAMGGE